MLEMATNAHAILTNAVIAAQKINHGRKLNAKWQVRQAVLDLTYVY